MARATVASRFSTSVSKPVDCEELPGLAEDGDEGIASSLGFVAGLTEEGVEGIILNASSSIGFVAGVNEEGVDGIVSSSIGLVAGLPDDGGVELVVGKFSRVIACIFIA